MIRHEADRADRKFVSDPLEKRASIVTETRLIA
jgi:hypothetical protein